MLSISFICFIMFIYIDILFPSTRFHFCLFSSLYVILFSLFYYRHFYINITIFSLSFHVSYRKFPSFICFESLSCILAFIIFLFIFPPQWLILVLLSFLIVFLFVLSFLFLLKILLVLLIKLFLVLLWLNQKVYLFSSNTCRLIYTIWFVYFN